MTETLSGHGWSVQPGDSGTIVALTGDWVALDESGAEPDAARRIMSAPDLKSIGFDTTELGHWDSALLVFVSDLRRAARERGVKFDPAGLPESAPRLLALIGEKPPPPPAKPQRVALVNRVGRSVIGLWTEGLAVMAVVGDTVLRAGAAFRGRIQMRGTDLLTATYEAGVAALPIVTIVNVLVGGILAFVGAVQLRRFGADIYVANLVGVSIVREMAALMTAIVMSGRTGGAYAAHIATMQGSEEIDALRAIGIPVFDYLVLPRIIALTVMMPLLYLYGCAVGIFGGFIVAVAMLSLSPDTFFDQTRLAVGGEQVVFGLVKSIAFGALIAIAGCRTGLRAGRSAADVGQAATTAVVIGIVGVIALDAVFAVCANALDF